MSDSNRAVEGIAGSECFKSSSMISLKKNLGIQCLKGLEELNDALSMRVKSLY